MIRASRPSCADWRSALLVIANRTNRHTSSASPAAGDIASGIVTVGVLNQAAGHRDIAASSVAAPRTSSARRAGTAISIEDLRADLGSVHDGDGVVNTHIPHRCACRQQTSLISAARHRRDADGDTTSPFPVVRKASRIVAIASSRANAVKSTRGRTVDTLPARRSSIDDDVTSPYVAEISPDRTTCCADGNDTRAKR